MPRLVTDWIGKKYKSFEFEPIIYIATLKYKSIITINPRRQIDKAITVINIIRSSYYYPQIQKKEKLKPWFYKRNSYHEENHCLKISEIDHTNGKSEVRVESKLQWTAKTDFLKTKKLKQNKTILKRKPK